jgi:hypothetical protein
MGRTVIVAIVVRMFLLVTIVPLVAVPSTGQRIRACKGNPELVARCFEVHGRIRIVNGGPQMRIWRIGTDRILGVLPSEGEIIPDNLSKALDAVGEWPEVYGDFEVCPFTKEKPEEMQMVCIESARHLVSRKNAY